MEEEIYTGNRPPKTIEELKIWYEARGLPPEETTRFFIGKKIDEARAFCIYKEDDIVTVYKNKNDGSRAIRYQGEDEEHAVNEFYLRLKQEIENQKFLSKYGEKAEAKQKKNKTQGVIFGSILAVICSIFALFSIRSCKQNKMQGYYVYNSSTYYCYMGNWYLFDGLDDYDRVDAPIELSDNYEQYRDNTTMYDDTEKDFFDTDTGSAAYEEAQANNSEAGSDWDSGDTWDSGGTDFDSDW